MPTVTLAFEATPQAAARMYAVLLAGAREAAETSVRRPLRSQDANTDRYAWAALAEELEVAAHRIQVAYPACTCGQEACLRWRLLTGACPGPTEPARSTCTYCSEPIVCYVGGAWIGAESDTRQCTGHPAGVLHAPRS